MHEGFASGHEGSKRPVPGAESRIRTCYQDAEWIVVDKPIGISTHAADSGDIGVVEWMRLFGGMDLHVCSRLDKGTSGLLMLARTPAAARRAQQIHQSEQAQKTYLFLSGTDSATEQMPATWSRNDPLDGKPATTRFERLRRIGDRTLFRAVLCRGRRHQVRRHAANSGIPLAGDAMYGGEPHPRLCLHCESITWPGLSDPIQAPPPASFSLEKDKGDSSLELELAVAHERRGQWFTGVTDAFRVINRDELSRFPIVVDMYGSWFSATGFDESLPVEELARQLDGCLDRVSRQYGCCGGIVRQHQRNPHKRTLTSSRVVIGEPPPPFFEVFEGDQKYRVSLTETQHIGLFLDQRDTRARMAQMVAGRRVANLFAYTCAFSNLAVARGAEVAFSIDLAKACLDTGKANFELNALTGTGRGKFIQSDVRQWLDRQLRKQERDTDQFRPFDLVICDPPVFAASKKYGAFSVEKEWPRLAAGVRQVLSPTGVAIFANNHRDGAESFYRQALESVFPRVVRLRPPLDFPERSAGPASVRTFWCESS